MLGSHNAGTAHTNSAEAKGKMAFMQFVLTERTRILQDRACLRTDNKTPGVKIPTASDLDLIYVRLFLIDLRQLKDMFKRCQVKNERSCEIAWFALMRHHNQRGQWRPAFRGIRESASGGPGFQSVGREVKDELHRSCSLASGCSYQQTPKTTAIDETQLPAVHR